MNRKAPAMTEPHRKPRVGPGVAAGVTEPMIRDLVHAFYARVRTDPVLGPIFDREVDDWPAHLAKLCDFWSSVLLMTGRFKGQPMAAHARLPDIAPAHFERWLELFGQTAKATCPPQAAALFVSKAEMIGQSLQLGIAASRGELPPAGAAPVRPSAKRLPPGLEAYNRTPVFTQATVPAGLLRAHSTKAGVWGRIVVLEGKLIYRITDPRRPRSEQVLSPTAPGVVEPTVLHEVEPQGAVRFLVEFLCKQV